ncbi:hypothetical protein ABTF76_21565, partial [Acinetobacter baumannii]
MQLREIMDLEAMLSKDPAPESLTDDEEGDGEISEKNAGPSFKEEDEPEEAPADEEDDEESMTERRAPRPSDDDDEDNTLS